MNQFLFFIDRLSAWTGKAFSWCILILAFATTYEVFVRYVLNAPTVWAFDMSVQMYGALFIAIGAAVSDMREAQSAMMPVMLLAMAPTLIISKQSIFLKKAIPSSIQLWTASSRRPSQNANCDFAFAR